MRRTRVVAALVPLAVLALAGTLRFAGLARVGQTYWDERFYALDASAYLGRTPAQLRPDRPPVAIAENSWMQPPLGKWLIAAGELPAAKSPWGYRSPAAVFGTLGVGLVYLLALELTASVPAAALAGLLVALDGLHLVQSRIAMLDVFASTLGLAGLYLLVRARPRPRSPTATSGHDPRPRRPPSLYLMSGACLGAAVACKWSAVPFLLLAAGFGWHWLPGLRPGWSLRRRWLGMLTCFAVLPALVYLASYTSFFVQNGPSVGGLVRLQWDMFQYGRHFDFAGASTSAAWTWPLLGGSIDYTQAVYFGGGLRIIGGNIDVLRVLTVGNPVLWWAWLGATPFLVWWSALRRDWRAGVVVLGYLAGWAPWLVAGRAAYGYYMLPAVPFMALGVGLALARLARADFRLPRVAVLAGAGLGAGAGAAAWAYYPVWTALPVGFYHFAALRHLPGIH
ncbi:MAG TPA: phospholipid carrier-dependent glycosyltransferase [Acidimicrobiales bacterium]|nr:phospholipid carrier-dependent glycosyltransferase [Acidimicrobiales bacterium]